MVPARLKAGPGPRARLASPRGGGLASAGGLLLGALVGCGGEPERTFNRDIAPILFENCAACHRPGQSAPFSLLTFEDARSHAQQIATVTRSRFMPPWLPEPGEHAFVGERRLAEAEIRSIGAWVEQGAAEGDARDLPSLPEWSTGWHLGEPDLVVELTEPYTVEAEGTDVFRNFVLPVPATAPRWVRAVELRPGNGRVVHHAIIKIDRTPASRRRDAEDPGPGFSGMDAGSAHDPDGHFLGFTPGRLPDPGTADMAWRLDRGTDIVLQLHLVPSGRLEPVQPSVGLHFADSPPTRHPAVIILYEDEIDIPAGERNHVVEQRFVLPVEVELLGLYPHAHYLGREIACTARFADGRATTLLRIDDWDFNWQDAFRYVRPVTLPAGTTILMRYTYDNSPDNVRNPHAPPERVRAGNRSSDEMATLTLQVLPRNEADRTRIQEAKSLYALEKDPHDAKARTNLGNALLRQGLPVQAVEHYLAALRVDPAAEEARYNLGLAYSQLGRTEDAVRELRLVLELHPDFAAAHNNLGNALLARGSPDEAIEHFRRAAQLQPSLSEAHFNLALALGERGDLDAAIGHYHDALEAEPRFAMAHNNLGSAELLRGRLAQAVQCFHQALEIDPQLAEAHSNLGHALAELGRAAEAEARLRRALEIDPGLVQAHANLGRLLAAAGRHEEAAVHLREAQRLEAEQALSREPPAAAGVAEARARL